MSTIRINIDEFDLNSPDNFWISNPQFRYLPPYSRLYDSDKSKNHSYSSRAMWVIAFMLIPDEDENLFFRRSIDERVEALKEFHPELDWEEKLFKECFDKFPNDCLGSIEREILSVRQSISDTIKLINETEQTFDRTEIIRNEKTGMPVSVPVKGTVLQINTLRKDVGKAIELLDELERRYRKEKAKTKGRGSQIIHQGQDKSFW